MFTKLGRFLFADPSAYVTQLPSEGCSNCRSGLPVLCSITAGKWFVWWQYIDRTTANSSITPPTCGNQSDTGIPAWPYRL